MEVSGTGRVRLDQFFFLSLQVALNHSIKHNINAVSQLLLHLLLFFKKIIDSFPFLFF